MKERDLSNNKFYLMTNYIMSFFITNMWFLILISPLLIYVFAFKGNSRPVIFLLSLTIGPALATLFSVVGKLKREVIINPTRDFFHFLRLDWLQGLLVSIIVNALISIACFDIVYFSSIKQSVPMYIMMALLVLIVLVAFYAYPIISRYNIKITYLFKLSLGLVIKKFYISMTCIAATIIILWLIRTARIAFVGFLFGTSIWCYLILKIENPVLIEIGPVIKEKYKNNI